MENEEFFTHIAAYCFTMIERFQKTFSDYNIPITEQGVFGSSSKSNIMKSRCLHHNKHLMLPFLIQEYLLELELKWLGLVFLKWEIRDLKVGLLIGFAIFWLFGLLASGSAGFQGLYILLVHSLYLVSYCILQAVSLVVCFHYFK